MAGIAPYSTTHEVIMVDGVAHGYAYGHLWPLRTYELRWDCGHNHTVTIACLTVKPDTCEMDGPCPDCYKGPFFNVYD